MLPGLIECDLGLLRLLLLLEGEMGRFCHFYLVRFLLLLLSLEPGVLGCARHHSVILLHMLG